MPVEAHQHACPSPRDRGRTRQMLGELLEHLEGMAVVVVALVAARELLEHADVLVADFAEVVVGEQHVQALENLGVQAVQGMRAPEQLLGLVLALAVQRGVVDRVRGVARAAELAVDLADLVPVLGVLRVAQFPDQLEELPRALAVLRADLDLREADQVPGRDLLDLPLQAQRLGRLRDVEEAVEHRARDVGERVRAVEVSEQLELHFVAAAIVVGLRRDEDLAQRAQIAEDLRPLVTLARDLEEELLALEDERVGEALLVLGLVVVVAVEAAVALAVREELQQAIFLERELDGLELLLAEPAILREAGTQRGALPRDLHQTAPQDRLFDEPRGK